MFDNVQIAERLLAAGANPTIRDSDGCTPAERADSPEMVALFAGLSRVKGAC